MPNINYKLHFNIPEGSKPVIEEIATIMENRSLIPNLSGEHVLGMPLDPPNLIALTARYGDAFEALSTTCEGLQFQQNLTLLKNLCLVVKELCEKGAKPVEGNYWIGDPREGQTMSLRCEMDYKGFRTRMEAVPTAISIYFGKGVVTGYERCKEAIEELVRTARPLKMERLALPPVVE